MAMEDLSMLKVTSMKELGKTTKPMDLGTTLTITAVDTKVNGCKINSMEKESRNGLMVQNMLVNTKKEKSMVKANLYGQIKALTKVISITTISTDVESIFGPMAESLMETGLTTVWKVKESLPGATVVNTSASIKMTRNTVMVYLLGLMDVATTVNGSKVSSMAKVFT